MRPNVIEIWADEEIQQQLNLRWVESRIFVRTMPPNLMTNVSTRMLHELYNHA